MSQLFKQTHGEFLKIPASNSKTLRICYQPHSQDNMANKTILQLLKEVLGQQNPILMGDYSYLGICLESNTMLHRFLEYIEDCFLLHILDMLTRKKRRGGEERTREKRRGEATNISSFHLPQLISLAVRDKEDFISYCKFRSCEDLELT